MKTAINPTHCLLRKNTFIFIAAIIAILLCRSAKAVKVEKDILFDTQNGIELKGDMYVPDGKGPFPGILFIHGGGFVGGSKDGPSISRLIMHFVENGYAVFNANYRLFKDNGIFPNNIKDSKCALAWMKKNATKYNFDPNRIGTMGESAGAYLAAMVALTPNDPDSRPDCPVAKDADLSVKAGILFYPPTDFTTFEGGFIKVMEVEIKRAAKLKSKKEAQEYKKKYSPITYADTSPPLFISFSDPDHTVPTQQGRIMTEALKKAGRTYDSQEVTGPGIDHGYILTQPDCPQSQEAKKRALALLDKYVKNAK